MERMKSVLSTLALAAALPFSFAACVVVDSQGHIVREEKRFTVTGKPDLRLATFDGAIEIRSGDSKTIVVEIEKPAHEVVFFGVGRMSPTAKLIVTMPRDGNVLAKSGDGSIRIEHV